jgi:HAD superfamily hydrolase (TIGR01509 family)
LNVEESSYSMLWPKLQDKWVRGDITNYQDALSQLCSQIGVKSDNSAIVKLTVQEQGRLLRIFRRIEPEITEMLGSLQRLGLKLGVVTNAHNLDTEPWSECLLAQYFDVFIASDEVGLVKPEPGIYFLACNQLGIRPSEAYFVGDGGSNELSGGEQAGMKTHWWTWFLDKWPDGITPNTFVGGEWCERPRSRGAPHTRVRNPEELISEITRTV